MAEHRPGALPAGWRVENLGLIGAVEFSHSDRSMLWCDGRWTTTTHGHTFPAPGIPEAGTMKEARKVGTDFLWTVQG